MSENQFDVAPVEVNDYIVKYAVLSDLEESSDTNRVIQEAKPLQEKHLIVKDVPVLVKDPKGRDLLTILAERDQHFSFVVEDGIDGIVTFADLNKSIAGTAFYHLISAFEDQIAREIDAAIEHDTWMEYFSEEKQREIRGRYSEGERENADLRLVNCLSTNELKQLILEYDIWRSIGFNNDEDANALLEEVIEIRHSVMHPRPVVGKNSIREIHETFQEVKRLLQNSNR
jgi:hypothetical protein